jgi:hypothetical protein
MEMTSNYPLLERTGNRLMDVYKQDGMSEEVKALLGNVTKGYPFPTNPDKRVPPGMAPASEQDLHIRGLNESRTKSKLMDELRTM